MRNVGGLIAGLLLAFFVAGRVEAQTQLFEATAGPALGQSVETGRACLDASKATVLNETEANEISITFRNRSTSQAVTSEQRLAARAKYLESSAAVTVTGSANARSTSDTVTFYVEVARRFRKRQILATGDTLIPLAKQMLESGNTEAFKRLCGTRYVSKDRLGALIIANVTINLSTLGRSNTSALKASAKIRYGAVEGEVAANLKQLFEQASVEGAVDIKVSTYGTSGSKPIGDLIRNSSADVKKYDGLLQALSGLVDNVSDNTWGSFDPEFTNYSDTLQKVAIGPTIELQKTEAILDRLETVNEELRQLRGMRSSIGRLTDPSLDDEGEPVPHVVWTTYPGGVRPAEFDRFVAQRPNWKERLIGGAIIVRGVERAALLHAVHRCLGNKPVDKDPFDLKAAVSTYAALAGNGPATNNYFEILVREGDDEAVGTSGERYQSPSNQPPPSDGSFRVRFSVDYKLAPTVEVKLKPIGCEIPEVNYGKVFANGLPFNIIRMGDLPEVRWRVRRPATFGDQPSIMLTPKSVGSYLEKGVLPSLREWKGSMFDGSVVMDVYVGWAMLYPRDSNLVGDLDLQQFYSLPWSKFRECYTETSQPNKTPMKRDAALLLSEAKWAASSCSAGIARIYGTIGASPKVSGVVSVLDDYFWNFAPEGEALTSVVAQHIDGSEFSAPIFRYSVELKRDTGGKITNRFMGKDLLLGKTAVSWGVAGQ